MYARIIPLIAAMGFASALAACAPMPNGGNVGHVYTSPVSYGGPVSRPLPVAAASGAVEIEESQFEPTIKFVGPAVQGGTRTVNAGDTFSRTHRLRSWLDKQSGRIRHQLYVSELYTGQWRFWNRANDQSARNLEFTSVDRNVTDCTGSRYNGCGYSEVYGASIEDASLRSARGGQYCTKFYARSGEESIICLTEHQVAAQLDAIDARRPRAVPPQLPPAPRRSSRTQPTI